jgi:hypothetical protein
VFNDSSANPAAALVNRSASIEQRVWVRVAMTPEQLEIDTPNVDSQATSGGVAPNVLDAIERVRRNHASTFAGLAQR